MKQTKSRAPQETCTYNLERTTTSRIIWFCYTEKGFGKFPLNLRFRAYMYFQQFLQRAFVLWMPGHYIDLEFRLTWVRVSTN